LLNEGGEIIIFWIFLLKIQNILLPLHQFEHTENGAL
jgi:hypothetical protein